MVICSRDVLILMFVSVDLWSCQIENYQCVNVIYWNCIPSYWETDSMYFFFGCVTMFDICVNFYFEILFCIFVLIFILRIFLRIFWGFFWGIYPRVELCVGTCGRFFEEIFEEILFLVKKNFFEKFFKFNLSQSKWEALTPLVPPHMISTVTDQ